MTKIWLLILILMPSVCLAQAENAAEVDAADDAKRAAEEEGQKKPTTVKDEVKQLKDQLATQKASFDAQLASQQEAIEELQLKQEEQELMQASSMLENDFKDTESFFRVFGFFDFTLHKWIFNPREAYSVWVSDDLSFLVSNLNLYFDSQISRTLRFLTELHFSFLPFGQEFGFEGELDGVDTGQKYQTVAGAQGHFYRDPFTTYEYYTGGVYIERAYFQYEPFDWLKLKAGRFLSPFGIWNMEHGSPVVVMARLPYMQVRQMVPSAQTGVELSGRFYPTYELYFDYAITVSNGRERFSPYDLDDKKAFGGRLHLSYEGNDAKVSGGTYVYYGNYSKIRKRAIIDTQKKSLQIEQIDDGVRDELMIATDLLIEFAGLKLQSEYVYRWDRVEVARPLTYEDQLLNAGDLTGEITGDYIYFDPSNTGYGVYVLVAYTLPLQKLLGDFLITPFVFYERSKYMDSKPHLSLNQFIGGLNLRPHPNVVLKVEFGYNRFDTSRYGKPIKDVSAQLAVSF